MPRIGLKAHLKTLREAGVRRYVRSTGEVEFFEAAPSAPEEMDRETAREAKAPPVPRDPLRMAMSDDPFPLGEEAEVEHN